jgi:hypothetical protein
LDYQQLAILFFCVFPSHQKLDVVIDRTEWDFGEYQCNILMVIISNRTIALPLYLLENNSGNSHTQDRIDLLSECLKILLPERISVVLGDREFIGQGWFKYLKNKGIPFCFRVPKNHHIVTYDQDMNPVIRLAENLHQQYPQGITLPEQFVDGVCGQVYIGTDNKGELLFLFGTLAANTLAKYYERRWTIEAFFQNLKTRGFDLESTHLQKSYKLKKLVACVSLAYTFCVNVGLYQHKKVQNIPLKNHGRKRNSFFRTGLNTIRNLLKKTDQLDAWIAKMVKIVSINAIRLRKKQPKLFLIIRV